MIEHSQSTQSNKFAISLQHLEQEVRNGFHLLHGDKHQSFYKSALSFLIEVARHVQNTQNRNLVIFLQYIKKVLQLPLCCIVMRNIFFRSPFLFVATCYLQNSTEQLWDNLRPESFFCVTVDLWQYGKRKILFKKVVHFFNQVTRWYIKVVIVHISSFLHKASMWFF